MGAVPCLQWIQAGLLANKPRQIQLTKKDLRRLSNKYIKQTNKCSFDYNDKLVDKKAHTRNGDSHDDEYKMEYYEDEGENILFGADFHNVAVFMENKEDPYLAKAEKSKSKVDIEESDSDDADEIRDNDNMLLLGTVNKQGDADIESHVYNHEMSEFYPHHEYPITSFPLSLEYVGIDENINLLAVGAMENTISLWDLNVTNTLTPTETLHGHGKGAVISLSKSDVNIGAMASGSENKEAIIWDLQSLKLVTRLKRHQDRVQTLKWHPTDEHLLVTGSSDRFVRLFDCRTIPSSCRRWKLHGEVEEILFYPLDSNYLVTCTDTGRISCVDVRGVGSKVFSARAHNDCVTGMSFSSKTLQCLVSVSSDETMKVWQCDPCSSDGLATIDMFRQPSSGPLLCVSQCPDHDFIFAIGGSKSGECLIKDIRKSDRVKQHPWVT